jgi:hypothetical protein
MPFNYNISSFGKIIGISGSRDFIRQNGLISAFNIIMKMVDGWRK